MITSIVNIHLRVAIYIHDSLHGLCQGRRTGKTILETKLVQQLMGI